MAQLSGHRRRRFHRIASLGRTGSARAHACAWPTASSPASAATSITCPASSSSKGDLAEMRFRAQRRRGHGLRAPPGGHSLGAALGEGSDHLESRERGRDAERARRGARRRRQARWCSPDRRRPTATRRRCPKREEMPTSPLSPYALQKVVGEQYLQMFTQLYGLETVSASATSTSSVRGRTRRRRTPASFPSSRPRCSRTARRRSTATASRRATSPTSPTSSTACCARARRRAPAGK